VVLGAHDFLVDPVKEFRGKQAQVVLEGLPQSLVLIGQFVDAVVVGIEAQPQHPEHEDTVHCIMPGRPVFGLTLPFAEARSGSTSSRRAKTRWRNSGSR
jgi:hypothetical protein